MHALLEAVIRGRAITQKDKDDLLVAARSTLEQGQRRVKGWDVVAVGVRAAVRAARQVVLELLGDGLPLKGYHGLVAHFQQGDNRLAGTCVGGHLCAFRGVAPR